MSYLHTFLNIKNLPFSLSFAGMWILFLNQAATDSLRQQVIIRMWPSQVPQGMYESLGKEKKTKTE